MSERPEKPQNDPIKPQGGWQIPREASPWQSPEQPTQPTVAWVTKALPDELDTAPEKRGDWHLPQAGDTPFSPADEITVTPQTGTGTAAVVRPEDLLAEIVGQKRAQAAMRPEDMIPQSRRKKEEETVAADKVNPEDTKLVDEASVSLPSLEDDDEELTMSEYMALASLAQGMDNTSNVNVADLSPAERALYNIASQAAADLPKATEPAVDAGATIQMQDTAASQAADYARQQLAALQSGATATPQGTSFQAPVPAAPQYTPEQIQLANQFRETKRQVQILRQMAAQGQIPPQELESRLQQHTILDPQGVWWMVGLETDQWYRYDNMSGQWEIAQPPVPMDAGLARTETGMGAVAADVMAGSLPYLPDQGQQINASEFSNYDDSQYAQAQQSYSQQYGVQDTPIPNPNQPVYDPNLTMVGSAVDQNTLSYAAPTMQGLNYVDEQATMPSSTYYEDEFPAQGEAVAQARPIATGYEDPNLNIPAPDFEAQDRRQIKPWQIVAGLAVGLFIIAILAVAGFVLYANNLYEQIVGEWRDEIASLGSAEFDFQTARILAADGTVIAEITGEQGARTLVSIDAGEVSPFFVHAVVSSEDPRFYENPGVDALAIVRAVFQNLTAGEVVSGASTITQQIVRERVLGSNIVSFDRKLTEALLALEVADNYSKNEILDIYINQFFYGENSYGVEAAAQFYFGVSAADLNAAQAATLVGILPSPSSANPVVAPLAAYGNMRVVLNRMVEANCLNFQHGTWAATGTPFCFNSDTLVNDGAGGQTRLFIRNADGTYGGALSVQIAQVETRRYEPRQSDILYPHFVYYVLGELDAAYGRGAYIDRGFTVYTTLDPRIQDAAETALDASVDDLRLNGAVTGGIVVVEPQTGAIRVMVGSPDFNNVEIDGQNNNALSYQQPGSSIKPILYTAALMGGPNGAYNPASIMWDVPTRFTLSDGSTYSPTNFDNQTRGPVPLRYALQQSLNIPAVKTYAFLGGEAFVTTANAMGINFDNPFDDLTPTFGLPTAIGATEVTLLDLTHAYSTLASDGVFSPLYVVDSITERSPNNNQIDVELIGNLVHSTQLQVVSPQVAYLMQNILSDENARTLNLNGVAAPFPANSPISGASLGLPNQNAVAVKTGTNNTAVNNLPSRIWTVGFTNNYAVGVWIGTLNQGTPMTGNVSGLRGAAPAWNAVMRAALNGRNPGNFQVPATGVVQQTVCFLTGTLASDNCPTRVNELFLESQQPAPADQGFVTTLQIDSWTGARANQWCAENVVTQSFANISDGYATAWLNNTNQGRAILTALRLPQNLPAAPSTECIQGAPLPTVRINFPTEGVVLLERVPITGQVSAENLNRWELQISPVGTDSFTTIMPQASNAQVQIAGTTLFEWDSRSVQNGQYILRLAAFSNINGGYIFREVRVQVQNIPPTPTPQPTAAIILPDATLPFDNLIATSTPDPFGN